ncbi:sensor domain-containing protein [Actinokineospora diospyrosa]|uniref:PAS domain S-box-containing protein/diguanylate cyclase (GGDEF) domain-containing protein n=1 Tax=Actinokineospora diospyrosa TaxID=103728 RepID=A0ABT1I7P5_9PSEU|nr:bifunctional diguanylate cyclase/phosphodiesterase [Actinokineospora diospyrosa]MCP2268596.1 PAS domain S-box-containing protein/diguanylate cyclase (GGDEF) domain-containing protein [Actinokineospora diospyrosa]
MAEHVVRAGLPRVALPPGGFDSDAGRVLAPDLTRPDVVGFTDDPAAERALLLEAQRIARMGSWTLDVLTGEAYLSDGLRGLCGLPARATLTDLLALVHPEDLPVLNDFQAALRARRSSQPLELEVRDDTGKRSYLVRARPEFETGGRVVRVHGTVQDFTRFRALERQLSQDGRLFREAQRVARLGTWEWNTVSGECLWSSMLYELFGVEAGTKITYRDYLQLVHPDDRSWVDQRWQELAGTRRPVECEHRVIRPDGKRRVFRVRGEAAGTDNDRNVMIGTAQDVTEQRSTETRMQRSSKRFTDLVAITPVGIALFDDAERLVDANDALCSLLGLDLERLRGMSAEQLTHPDDREARRGRESHSFHSGQRVLVTATGKPVYCELNATVSVADDGQRFWLVVFADVTDRRRAAERLRYQATHDELTGLPGRAAVKELLGKLLGGRDYERIALLFCDVDNFKRVNDSLGHDVGDELITALARRLERGLPPSCTVARMSGDEYVIICSDVEEAGGVEALANQVASLLRTAVPVRDQLLRVSACIGAAVPSGPETSGADLLRYADAAMFAAKARGTGRVSIASDKLIASANSQMLLEGQLREAIMNDQLVLHYQPVVGPDGAVLSAEALVRWPHPERGLLYPGDFLPVAEQGDLLGELDRWVLRAAFTEAAEWPQLCGAILGGGVGIAVNLSGLVPGDPEFVDVVSASVAATGIAWDRVVLELVETSLIDLPSRSREAMAELVERGVRFAVDDFGTGYSSLARLKELPAQIIKIDRRFVSGVATDASDFAVARALVDMARAMGRSCVAEGVENATQFHVLRGVGVDAYQGWLLSKPLPAKEFREILKLGPVHIPRGT